MSNYLPNMYIELEYIESSRTQYIDTGVNADSNLRVVLDMAYTSVSNNNYTNIGAIKYDETIQSGDRYRRYHMLQQNNNLRHFTNTSSTTIGQADTDRHIFNFDVPNGKYYIDEQVTTMPTSEFDTQLNYWLFGRNSDKTNLRYLSSMQIYSCKMYYNDSLVRSFVPCYRKSDNVIGMYDVVNGVFYTNKGTGTFIKGPEVSTSTKEVSTIDWTKSMLQKFEYYEVDPNTWKDKSLITTIKSSSINKDSESNLLETADIEIIDTVGECYIRIYLIATQDDITEKVPLGTYLVQTPSTSFDGKVKNVSMTAYSPLIELKENPVPLGFTLLKNENIMENAYQVVKDNCRAPVIKTASDKTLTDNFVANTEDTYLTFTSDLIQQAKYKFGLDELGQILFSPIQKVETLQPVYTFNDDNASILLPEVTLKHDIYGIPNVVEVVCTINNSTYTSVVKNEDPNSPTSIQNRGRIITHRVTDPNLYGVPTEQQVDEYAEQLLSSLSSVEYVVNFSHGYYPLRIGDCIRLNYEKAELKNIKAVITAQSIKCGTGCTVSTTATFTKKLWK